ncbi:MAG: pyridoxal phosphate-dependent aminotransferase [Bacteroidales bacterium]|nr:pyridoxal phosphate-dependent aminotransferase [Bacteroidales bacterium]
MPAISKSAAAIPASPIRMLSPFADKAEADGVKIYHLNIGAPDIKSPESALAAFREISFDHLPYSNSAGTLELRKALVEKYYPKQGIKIGVDDVLVTTAGSEALSFVFHAALDPGDEVLVMEPYYCNYNTLAKMNGVVLNAVHTDIESGFAAPDPETIESHITPATRAILVCNPSNPTGVVYSKKDILAIADICRKHDLFLISDEAYREFCYSDEPYFSVMQIPDFEENAILVDSASKRYNLCGARVGCLVSRNKELISLVTKFAQARLCPPVIGQAVSLAAINAPDNYFKAVRDEYIARRNYTVDALNAIQGVYSPKPQGAFYTVAELPVDDATAFCKWLLTDFRLNGETVMLTPAEPFYSTPRQGRNQVRVAYVLEIPELEKAMKILETALVEYKKD